MPEIHELIDYMAGIMKEADAIITEGGENRTRLQPLRLKMASTITSFQLVLNSRLTVLDRKGDARTPDLRRAAAEWATLANDYRAFASRNLSAEPPDWTEYAKTAREFMHRFERHMRYIRKMLPILDHHALTD